MPDYFISMHFQITCICIVIFQKLIPLFFQFTFVSREGDKSNVFCDTTMFPDLKACHEEIANTEKRLNDLKPEICKVLKLISFKYATVNLQKVFMYGLQSYISN